MVYPFIAIALFVGIDRSLGPLDKPANSTNSKIEPLVEINQTALQRELYPVTTSGPRPLVKLNTTALQGKWYQVETSDPAGIDCISIEWKLSRSGNLQTVLEGRVINTNASFRMPSFPVKREPDVAGTPKFKVAFPTGFEIDFLIFAVDYDEFFILSVRDPRTSKSNIRILTRTQNPSEGLMNQIRYYNAMMGDVASLTFKKTNQSGCNPNPTTIIPESIIID